MITALKKLAAKIKEIEIVEFLQKTPNPNDKQVHDWSEKNGYDVHEVERLAYVLATKFANILGGGRAKEKGMTIKDFDPEAIKKGIKIELEHTKDKDVAKIIAMDHLAEHPKYYDALEKMEKELEI